ncbi:MAG: TIR domain-containing protein [Chitinophagaceae bacterium]
MGSSSEGLNVAKLIQAQLSNDFEPAIWNQGTVFMNDKSHLENLESAVSVYDFIIFVFTPDDKIEIRGESKKMARDNVIFELGMFIGKLKRMKAFLVFPTDTNLKILSDFDGIEKATIDDTKSDLNAALGDACYKIKESIRIISNTYKVKP